ncbi:MAG: hypothetical protein WDZ79_02975 [Candidatus Paceibacterota bacterium]
MHSVSPGIDHFPFDIDEGEIPEIDEELRDGAHADPDTDSVEGEPDDWESDHFSSLRLEEVLSLHAGQEEED